MGVQGQHQTANQGQHQTFMDSIMLAAKKKKIPQRKQTVQAGVGMTEAVQTSAVQASTIEAHPVQASVDQIDSSQTDTLQMPTPENQDIVERVRERNSDAAQTSTPSTADNSTFLSAEAMNRSGSKTGKLRVAAYIRVSTDMDDQENSYETQDRYFSEMLSRNPDWISAGVYSDYGISGTGKEKRTGFKRLLRHCTEGKIDRIVTKSISRFTRNTADFLSSLKILHEHNISIFFEKEGLDTADPTSDFILTTLAAIAQEESRSISGNINLGNRMRFPRGEVPNREIYGYRYTGDYTVKDSGYRYRAVEIVEEEAETVRWIFQSYIDGKGLVEMARELNRKHIPHKISAQSKKRMEDSQKGQLNATLDDGWTAGMVGNILKNERYTGDVLIQKTYTRDHLTHKTMRNKGEVQQFYVRDHHPAIISREMFAEAKKLREAHRITHGNSKTDYPFSGRLICGHCGRFYNVRNTKSHPIWYCPTQTRNNGKITCRGEKVYEEQIVRMFRKAVIERFGLTDTPVADDVTVADIFSGRYAETSSLSDAADGFVGQMLARLVNLQRMDFVERDRAFLKRQILAAEAVLEKEKKKVRLLKSRKEAMDTRRLVLGDLSITSEMVEKVTRELAEAEERLSAAEAEYRKAREKLDYMEQYWTELEANHDWREKAISWMKGLPGGKEGAAAFLNGMSGEYAKAFILSITIHDPLHYTVHWFDDTKTEVEMYSNIEDYRYTAAYFDGSRMRERKYRRRK